MLVFTLAYLALPNTIERFKTTYEVKRAGTGDQIVLMGDTISLHVEARVSTKHKNFVSTGDDGERPWTFQAGYGGTIIGIDHGSFGMRIGEIRKLEIPFFEAYGTQGTDVVPPRSNLVAFIELLRIRRGGQGTGRGHWFAPHAPVEDHEHTHRMKPEL